MHRAVSPNYSSVLTGLEKMKKSSGVCLCIIQNCQQQLSLDFRSCSLCPGPTPLNFKNQAAMLQSELVSVHAQVRDHVKKSGGKPPRWRRMLGYHFMARTPRDPSAVMLQVAPQCSPLPSWHPIRRQILNLQEQQPSCCLLSSVLQALHNS